MTMISIRPLWLSRIFPEHEIWQIIFLNFRIGLEHSIRLSIDSKEEDKNSVGIRPCRNYPQHLSSNTAFRHVDVNAPARRISRTRYCEIWKTEIEYWRPLASRNLKLVESCARKSRSESSIFIARGDRKTMLALSFSSSCIGSFIYIINNNRQQFIGYSHTEMG